MECAVPKMKKKKELGPFLSDGSTEEGGADGIREWTQYRNPVVLLPRRRRQKQRAMNMRAPDRDYRRLMA